MGERVWCELKWILPPDLALQVADRLNELEVPMEILQTKQMRHEFRMFQKGRRVMLVLDAGEKILVGYRKA